MRTESGYAVVVMKEGGAKGALALGHILDRPDADFATMIQPTGVPRDHGETRYCPSLGVATVPLSAPILNKLQSDERVASAGEDRRWSVGQTTFQPTAREATPMRALTAPVAATNSPSLIAVGLHNTYRKATGRGVRVAVIDTGVDTSHPDLSLGDRVIDVRCFLEGRDPKDVHDGHGHGTMCAGLVGGRALTEARYRYSVAPEASLIVAKAMDDDGKGFESDILEAICWAVMKKARVISLSIGCRRDAGHPADPDYERVCTRLTALDVLVVAAAGDRSSRPSRLAPVDDPAACASILAVGAVDAHDAIASFSPATMDSVGAIDLCAPGQGVLSASALDQQGAYWSSASGTSAAAPIVSGVAALHLELSPKLTVDELIGRLNGDARTTPDHNARDFGSGIVRVPS